MSADGTRESRWRNEHLVGASYRLTEVARAVGRGWALTPLRGKVPILAGWQAAPKVDLDQAQRWAREGNIGLRTGAVSGVVAIDVDTAMGGSVEHLGLPRTVTVVTGSGGRHIYFRHPGGKFPNSVGRLAAHVDVRADGGQVVFPGSVHPQTGRVYRWADGLSPDDLPLADLPEPILHQLLPPTPMASVRRFPISDRIPGRSTAYGEAALSREAEAIRATCQGTRNDRLNRAAFSLGRLVAAGHLQETDVTYTLYHAAGDSGLSSKEVQRTIRSGLFAGMRHSR